MTIADTIAHFLFNYEMCREPVLRITYNIYRKRIEVEPRMLRIQRGTAYAETRPTHFETGINAIEYHCCLIIIVGVR